MAHDRSVAGIRCTEILAILPDYLEGALDARTVARLEAHLEGCDWCERFGADYAATVGAIRRQLHSAEELDEGVRARLRARLDAEG